MEHFRPTSLLLASAVLLATGAAASEARAQAVPETSASASGGGCPVSYATLKTNLATAVKKTPGGFGNEMWAVAVDRDGTVCAVAFSGKDRSSQWLLSRQIAAAKAFTANGLSLDGAPLSTQQLDPLVQPSKDGGSLFGVADGNPLDAAAAYKGPASKFGTASDPLVGKRAGGTITFGGGLGLYKGGGSAVGGLGLSGDTACRDDAIARALRTLLKLAPTADDKGPSCKL